MTKRFQITGHGDIRNVRAFCICGCGTQVRINIIRDKAFPQVEINVKEEGAQRWRGAVLESVDALKLAQEIIDNLAPRAE